jgi:Resolvase, N terminal domain
MSSENPSTTYRFGYTRVSTLKHDQALAARHLHGSRLPQGLRRPGLREARASPGPRRHDGAAARRGQRHRVEAGPARAVAAPPDRRRQWPRPARGGAPVPTESIETSTPGGKLTFHLFGALAEFERDLIRERTIAGLAAARTRGRTGGWPTVWTPEKLRVARSMHDSGGPRRRHHRPSGRGEPCVDISRARESCSSAQHPAAPGKDVTALAGSRGGRGRPGCIRVLQSSAQAPRRPRGAGNRGHRQAGCRPRASPHERHLVEAHPPGVLTSVTSTYGVFPLAGRLARLGCTRGGSPGIFGVPTP